MSWVPIRLLLVLIPLIFGIVIAAVLMTRKVPKLESPTMPTTQCFPGLGQKIETLKPVEGGYFPERAFYKDEIRNRFVSNWYTRYLAQMNEPSLLVSHGDRNASYRFLWLRSFHPTVVVRFWSDGEKYLISTKELSLKNQTQSNQSLADQTRALKDEEWITFVKLVEASCFWTIPTTINGPIAMDGAWWVIEGLQQDYYHVAIRQSPDSGSYRELGLYILKLSGLPLDDAKGEIY